MNQVEIEQLLYNAALAQAVVHGFRLGNGADQQIQGFATTSAQELASLPGDYAAAQDRLTDAVRSFRLLVDTMISVRKDAYRGKPELLAGNVIGEDTLSMTWGRLCPGLWPIC